MKRVIGKLACTTISGASLALGLAASVQAATADECRALVGFNSALAQPTAPLSGAWAVVDANGGYFTSKNDVQSCEVKAVTGPRAKISTVIYVAGPMTQDECSQYNSLSAIDSKIAQKKFADAYSSATTMISRLDGLAGTAKLIDPGYAAIRQSVVAIQSCVATL